MHISWRRLLYSACWYLLLPAILVRLLLKSRANKAYRQRWGERFGWVKPSKTSTQRPKQKTICLHAVSVGEVMAARTLLEALLRAMPEYRLWVTTTTPTGSDTVQRLFAGRVEHSYLPYDLPGAGKRFLTAVQPALLLVMETELWPNLYANCARRTIPLLLINARLSKRSVRRYHKAGALVTETLACVHGIMARSQRDATYFHQLGATPACITITGNIKFDLKPDPSVAKRGTTIRQQLAHRPIWCAGSTHPGEEATLLAVHAKLVQQFPDLLLILVPRHPERFKAVGELCAASGLAWIRRSQQTCPTLEHNVLLGDSMGELMLWYAASDLAFVGGSLVPVGGHNPLEALAFGVPVISGRYVHNFQDLYPLLQRTQSTKLVASTDELYDIVRYWLQHSDRRRACGRAGKAFMQANRGVVKRLLRAINTCLSK